MVKKMHYMGEDESNRPMRRIDSFLVGVYRQVPFTYIWLFKRSFDKFLESKRKISVLDIGCGDGFAMGRLNLPRNFEITGLDIFEPYLKIAKGKKIYKRLIKMDARKIGIDKKYDIVLASHVLEHLDHAEGERFIKKLEKIANKRVIIAAPIGYFPQGEYDNNSYQLHKSQWRVDDLKKLGYSISSQGLRILWGNENIVKKYGIFSYFLFLLSLVSTPLLLVKPELGTYMICRKDVKK